VAISPEASAFHWSMSYYGLGMTVGSDSFYSTHYATFDRKDRDSSKTYFDYTGAEKTLYHLTVSDNLSRQDSILIDKR